eukprot:TRINITY_DN2922_c0_g1_i15.p1 TRINITY_DN2922_c0_g1~~TRINITY_DN2922_c0_g1_i15.p1  ORF type:complete len:188 (+),score=23.31 TRINITY_DN2922_c0_g1_i15:244-807(+)
MMSTAYKAFDDWAFLKKLFHCLNLQLDSLCRSKLCSECSTFTSKVKLGIHRCFCWWIDVSSSLLANDSIRTFTVGLSLPAVAATAEISNDRSKHRCLKLLNSLFLPSLTFENRDQDVPHLEEAIPMFHILSKCAYQVDEVRLVSLTCSSFQQLCLMVMGLLPYCNCSLRFSHEFVSVRLVSAKDQLV